MLVLLKLWLAGTVKALTVLLELMSMLPLIVVVSELERIDQLVSVAT